MAVAEMARTMAEEEAEVLVVAEAAAMDEVAKAEVVDENDECHNCHQCGHFARNCPNRERLNATVHADPPPPQQKQQNQNQPWRRRGEQVNMTRNVVIEDDPRPYENERIGATPKRRNQRRES